MRRDKDKVPFVAPLWITVTQAVLPWVGLFLWSVGMLAYLHWMDL